MEWLRALIAAAIKEGETLDVAALMTQVEAEASKHIVPKADYENIDNQLKTANTTIADLKKSNADNEELQKKIAGHETTIQGLQDENTKIRQEYNLKEALQKNGVTDPGYIIYMHGGIDKFNFDKENKPIGTDEVIKGYKESHAHLFKTEKPPVVRGAAPAGSKDPDEEDDSAVAFAKSLAQGTAANANDQNIYFGGGN